MLSPAAGNIGAVRARVTDLAVKIGVGQRIQESVCAFSGRVHVIFGTLVGDKFSSGQERPGDGRENAAGWL